MGTRYGNIAATGFNASPPPDDGSQSANNLITWTSIKTKLADPLKTEIDAINTALVSAFDYSVRQVTAAYPTVAADNMRTIEIAPTVTNTITVSLGDATTMTSNYIVAVRNSSAINQIISLVTGGDTINGVARNLTIIPQTTITFTTNVNANGYLTLNGSTNQSVNLIDFGATVTYSASTPVSSVQTSNSAALNAAIRYLIKIGGGKLIIPDGFIHLNDVHEISTFVQASDGPSIPFWAYVIEIIGEGRATLVQNHATLPLIRSWSSGSIKLRMKNVQLFGRGSTTTGPLLELIANGQATLEGVTFHGTGGIGLFLVGSERITTYDLKFFNCRQAIVESAGAASNENYWFNTQIVSPGFTVDPMDGTSNKKSYSINVAGDGFSIKTSGNYFSEHHHAVEIRGAVNNRFIGGSIKVTDHIGGILVRGCENIGLDNLYFEGLALGANPSLTFYGQAEATTLPSGVAAAGTLTVPVASSLWFGRESSDARFDASFTPISAVIYDPANVAVFEVVTLRCFRGGNAILTARGQAGGIAAQAWGAGVVLREYFGNVGNNNNVLAIVTNCHLESYQAVPGTCALQASAQFGFTTGEALVGIQYDEFHTTSAMLQGAAIVQFHGNDLRTYAPVNSGKIQSWVSATIDILDKAWTTAQVAIAQSNSAAAFYTNTTIRGPDFHFNTSASNGVSIERAGAGISLGGGGRVVYRMMGETGIALTENTNAALLMASFDLVGGEVAWKIRGVNTGGAGTWGYSTALGDGWCKINGFYTRQGMGVSADRGDAAQTLTVGTDSPTQRWATPLTANRAVTLSTTGALVGNKWHIVRTAAATGASTLDVGTGPLKSLAAGQWCDVEYTGSVWILTGFGSL